MMVFVVEVLHSKMRGSWSEYYLVFAENSDAALEKAKIEICHTRSDSLSIEQEIKHGETTYIYQD